MVNKYALQREHQLHHFCCLAAELKEGGEETSELKQFLLPLDENVCGLKQT